MEVTMLPEGDKVPLGHEDGNQRNFAQLAQLGRGTQRANKEVNSPQENPIITPHEKDEEKQRGYE